MPTPQIPRRSLEEGASDVSFDGGSSSVISTTPGSTTRFLQRRGPPPPPERSPKSTNSSSSSSSSFFPPSSARPSAPLSSSSDGRCWAACFDKPYVLLLTTLLLFALLLLLTSSSFIFLRAEHHPHHFALSSSASSPLSSDLLSVHPAYVALTRQLTSQYQSLLSLAKSHMTEEAWEEFQAEAAKLDSTPPAIDPSIPSPLLSSQHSSPSSPSPSPSPSFPTTCPPCSSSRLSELTNAQLMTDWSVNSTAPLAPHDLALDSSYDWRVHEHEWVYCDVAKVAVPFMGDVEVCDVADFRKEQWFQKNQFIIPSARGVPVDKPHAPDCIWPPSPSYAFPAKHATLPAQPNSSWVRWENHYVMNAYNLSMFNYGYSKNLYHFDAPYYDRQQMERLNVISQHIPFASKVRNALDIGAGGGSLSLLLHRRYDVITLNLVYAELPYCEYITERGGLCAYITAFWSMPFAKHSYDFIHIAWLFHMYSGWSLVEKLMEINRILRPGGYLWWEGGFSYAQRDSVKDWAASLGYSLVYQDSVDVFDGTMFHKEKHECDFTAVFRKPSRGRIECKGQT